MVNVSSDVIDKIIKIVRDGGGEVFEQEGYINFCGVRNNITNDTFNDTLYIYWKDITDGNFKCVKTTGFTTKPGKKAVLNESGNTNSKGVAIVKEGWYKDVWHLGKHNPTKPSGHQALRQTQGKTQPITITRDNTQFGNKGNYELRILSDTIEVGYPYTNMHRCKDPQGNNVNGWSEGCQVFKYKNEFDVMIDMATFAASKGQTTFSYFLTNKTVFDESGAVDNNTNNTSYNLEQSQFAGVTNNSTSTSSSGAYGNCSGVQQLGSYTNAPDAQIIHHHAQNREDVLNTLVNGSYTPKEIKKCKELISSEKKKNKKTKSET